MTPTEQEQFEQDRRTCEPTTAEMIGTLHAAAAEDPTRTVNGIYLREYAEWLAALDAEDAKWFKDASDYVYRLVVLQKQLDQRWTDVRERLPEEGQTVQLHRPGFSPSIATRRGDFWSNDNWHYDVVIATGPYTRWHALPEPPVAKPDEQSTEPA